MVAVRRGIGTLRRLLYAFQNLSHAASTAARSAASRGLIRADPRAAVPEGAELGVGAVDTVGAGLLGAVAVPTGRVCVDGGRCALGAVTTDPSLLIDEPEGERGAADVALVVAEGDDGSMALPPTVKLADGPATGALVQLTAASQAATTRATH